MLARVRCHVLETPVQDDWLSRRGGGPRELLPWADPYIAGLMRRLENRFSAGDELADCDPFTSDDDPLGTAIFDDGWQEDAFMPRPVEAPRFHSYPPVYGEFALLQDAFEVDDAETL